MIDKTNSKHAKINMGRANSSKCLLKTRTQFALYWKQSTFEILQLFRLSWIIIIKTLRNKSQYKSVKLTKHGYEFVVCLFFSSKVQIMFWSWDQTQFVISLTHVNFCSFSVWLRMWLIRLVSKCSCTHFSIQSDRRVDTLPHTSVFPEMNVIEIL